MLPDTYEINTVAIWIRETDKESAMGVTNVEGRLIEAQEAERTRVAAELHDNIAQRIAVLAMGLDELNNPRSLLTDEVRAKLRALSGQTVALAQEVARLSSNLRPGHLEHVGIAAAAASLCRDIATQRNVDIAFSRKGVPARVPPNVALGVFRIVHEAVMNAVEHAGVGRVAVALRGTSDEIRLEIVDAGIGFDVDAARNARGTGLIGIEAYVGLLGGDLAIQSRPGEGTTIRARVPLSAPNAVTDR
jgi:signal transduction histidine kinase